LFVFLVGLGFELRAQHLQSCCSKAYVLLLEPHVQSIFALVILKMESGELLALLAWNLDPLDLSFPSS
jgi:hypothetical protein